MLANEETQETLIQSLSWENSAEGANRPTLVFLSGESHRQRSLEGYSRGTTRESDTT